MQPVNGFGWFSFALKKYATFAGRARRREFWYFYLFQCVFAAVAGAIDGALSTGVIAPLYSLATLLPGLGVTIRRLHDTNHSGWWCLLPVVNLIFLCADSDPGANRFGPPVKFAGARTGAGVSGPGFMSNLDGLERLASLREKGIITDAEFEAKKRDLL